MKKRLTQIFADSKKTLVRKTCRIRLKKECKWELMEEFFSEYLKSLKAKEDS
jgi:hypothetical protein